MNINGLRIVIEQDATAPTGYKCVYVGKDGTESSNAIAADTKNWRMEFRPMHGTRRNRPTAPVSVAQSIDSPAPESPAPFVVEQVTESPKPESPKSKKKST